MTHKTLSAVTGAVVLALGASSAMAAAPNKELGNQEYQLNIIGMDSKLTQKLKNQYQDNGRRMFVSLSGKTTINLSASTGGFNVLDADGTDGVASFEMPNPDPDGDGTTVYQVWARALGKPGGQAAVVTCAYDDSSGTEVLVCDAPGEVTLTSTKGKRTWDNVTRELLYLEYDIDGDGRKELIPLFDDALYGYFWEYDNNGLRLAQLRFYDEVYNACLEAGGSIDTNGRCELP